MVTLQSSCDKTVMDLKCPVLSTAGEMIYYNGAATWHDSPPHHKSHLITCIKSRPSLLHSRRRENMKNHVQHEEMCRTFTHDTITRLRSIYFQLHKAACSSLAAGWEGRCYICHSHRLDSNRAIYHMQHAR